MRQSLCGQVYSKQLQATHTKKTSYLFTRHHGLTCPPISPNPASDSNNIWSHPLNNRFVKTALMLLSLTTGLHHPIYTYTHTFAISVEHFLSSSRKNVDYIYAYRYSLASLKEEFAFGSLVFLPMNPFILCARAIKGACLQALQFQRKPRPNFL